MSDNTDISDPDDESAPAVIDSDVADNLASSDGICLRDNIAEYLFNNQAILKRMYM